MTGIKSRLVGYTPEARAFFTDMRLNHVPTHAATVLLAAGVRSWSTIRALSDGELLRTPGLGRASLKAVRAAAKRAPLEPEEQQSVARLADRGDEWRELDLLEQISPMARDVVVVCRQALHDRDRFQRERDYWREQCGA